MNVFNKPIENYKIIFIISCTLISVKGKGKVIPGLNQAPSHEDVLGEWGIAPLIL
jgi:hypothetical protein